MNISVQSPATADPALLSPSPLVQSQKDAIEEPELDLTLPLSTLLRDSTVRAHDEVAQSEGAKALLGGHLPKDDYVKYLFMLWHLYDTLEHALDLHASHPSLAPTYNARLLARSEAISNDIAHLLDVSSVSPDEWQAHPLYQSFLPLPSALTAYTSRIEEISSSSDPTPLLAHSYVRYLGDLSGGQVVKRIIQKAYGLEDSGYSFYEFGKLDGSSSGGELANLGDMKKLKEWFRAGIDSGVTETHQKLAVAREASRAFEHNGALLSVLEESPDTSPSTLTPTESEDEQVEASPLVTNIKGSLEENPSGYALPAFLSLLLAMGLAHFMLTVGGFTGKKGGQKLETLFDYVSHYLDSLTATLGLDNM
ncbi:hypothetical protein FRC03_002952 [Tulasnella sp. 419]|nr:hypothetical protein FRC03_002952 [Tulasnella sp. 419]